MKAFLVLIVACMYIVKGRADFTCPAGWRNHGTSCYHFSHDQESWPDALIMCQQLGGHLVDVNDATENTWLLSQIKPFNRVFWMDLSDIQVEGVWKWMSIQSNLSFSDWGHGEPNNSGGVENCVELHNAGYWNDNLCKTPQNYICEMEEGDPVGGLIVG